MIIQSNIQNNNKTAFGTRIIISNEAYENLKSVREKLFYAKRYSRKPWTIKQAIRGPESYSDLADCCSIAVIKAGGGNDGFLTHLIPVGMDNSFFNRLFGLCRFPAIQKKITEVAEQFRHSSENSSGKLAGIIIGGTNNNSKASKASKLLYGKLIDLFKNLNVDSTTICGRHSENGYVNLYFSAKEDKVVVKICEDKQPKNMEELKQMFSIVHISPNDTVEFG